MSCPHDLNEREAAVAADGICPLCLIADSTQKTAEFYNLTKQHEKLLAARDLSARASATMRDESIAKSTRIRELEAELANWKLQCTGRHGSQMLCGSVPGKPAITKGNEK